MLFEKVRKEHIIQGITDFETNGFPEGFGPSSTYDLVNKEKRYPPKAIMAYANYNATGEKPINNFKGGEGTDCFLAFEREGFKLMKKTPIIDLVTEFLEQSKTNNLKTKHYLKSYKGLKVKVSFGAGNIARIPWIAFLQPPNKVQDGIYPGLLYYKDVGKLVLVYGTSETNSSLFSWGKDEAVSINDWYSENFANNAERYGTSKIKVIYDVDNINRENLQDDVDEIIEEYKAIDFTNFDNENTSKSKSNSNVNYWVFQGNPKVFDFEKAIRDNSLNTFTVSAHRDKIKTGDKVVIWLSGTNAGCYALAEITHEPRKSLINESDAHWQVEQPTDIKAGISITHNFYRNPVLKKQIVNNSNLKNLKVGFQGSTFSATKLEYENILDMAQGLSDGLVSQISFNINRFKSNCHNAGLVYGDTLITRFASSLLTKPFVILTGLSGSGKTKLAQAFTLWICQDESQYRIIPVGADWTNREPLLGYPNALNPEEYVKPDSGVLDLIIQANQQPELLHFLILDEMNLSHVERYFADFLSVMESREAIPLYAEDMADNGVPPKLNLPSNLFIIGTVNIDETTNMFSPKVLDRANTIEFRVTKKEMESFLGNIKAINMDALTGKGAGMAKSFLELASNKTFATEDIDEINKALVRFFGELKKTGAEFGYRSATEILRLIHQLSVLDNSLTTNQKLDIAIMQKLLPKLHGSRRKLCPVLETLGSFCITGDIKIIKDVFEKSDFDFNVDNVQYPLSLEKIARMYRGAIDNGFASFAEA